MTRYVLMTMLLAVPLAAAPAKHSLSFTKLWTHGHTTPGQVSEIPAFDHKTNTIWVAGVVGVDVLDAAATGALVEHIDVTGYGLVNSVAIHNGLAAFAIEAGPPDRRLPGVVVFYDTRTRLPIGDPVTVGALPDMLTFTHDGSKLLVANEATPNAVADTPYTLTPDPPGSVSIIDVETRTVIATAGFENVPQFGTNLRTNVGMDFEPEYIAIEKDGSRAFVTLQEANAIAVLDLSLNAFTEIIGLGAKDFSLPGNEFDPKDNNDGRVRHRQRQGPVHAGRRRVISSGAAGPISCSPTKGTSGRTTSIVPRPAVRRTRPPLLWTACASPTGILRPDNLYAAGARSFSIRDVDGNDGRTTAAASSTPRPTTAASTTTAAAATRAWSRRASR